MALIVSSKDIMGLSAVVDLGILVCDQATVKFADSDRRPSAAPHSVFPLYLLRQQVLIIWATPNIQDLLVLDCEMDGSGATYITQRSGFV